MKMSRFSCAAPFVCFGCGNAILDRFLLESLGKYWHEDCLKCSCCSCRLGEVGSSLYSKTGMLLCKRDYFRLFGKSGTCASCDKRIHAFEMIMRAGDNCYHLDCFACSKCQQRFCVGDKFYLFGNRILCEFDFTQGSSGYSGVDDASNSALAQFLTSEPSVISQSGDLDFVPVNIGSDGSILSQNTSSS